PPRGPEVALRPERDAAVAGLAREAHALVDEAFAEALAPRLGLEEQEPQLRDGRGLPDQEDAAEEAPVPLRDPAALLPRVVGLDEVGDDARDQALERAVVAELAGVEQAVALHDPPQVAGLRGPQHDGTRGSRGLAQQLPDRAHRLAKPLFSARGQPLQHRPDL